MPKEKAYHERKKTSFKEQFKTYKDVFDLFTENNLFKLITQGYFEGLESPISIGKEANIFTALTKENERVIVKIYRLQTCDFNKMYEYIRYDPRFPSINRTKRKIIFAWAQREYRNLLKAREAQARVPTPKTFLNNVLVMDYIGDETPAPKLKDQKPKDAMQFLSDIIENVRKLYKAGLVHGDLSHFNILNNDEKPVIIDMSQATTLDNPKAKEYLERDIKNICDYFKKLGLAVDERKVKEQIIK